MIVLFGHNFRAGSPWTSIGHALGLGDRGWEEIVGAMQAAGEACGRTFVLMVDALNEADAPEIWASELVGLRRRLTQSPWTALAVTCRSSYLDVVLPAEGDGPNHDFAWVEHPGFAGREEEAAQHLFSVYSLEQPRIPLLLPEFSNPLFLKLYCEGQLDLPAPAQGHRHLTRVFSDFVEGRACRIDQRLGLDRLARTVQRAVAAFARELAGRGRSHLPYKDAGELVDGFAPDRVGFARTLFHTLLSEGVLGSERIYTDDGYAHVVHFPYQRFSDHLIVGSLIDHHLSSPDDVEGAFAPEGGLGKWLPDAPQGFIEALSIQLPERLGLELMHAADAILPEDWHRHRWFSAFLDSVVARDRSAITEASRELLNEAIAAGLGEEAIRAIVQVAPDPDHPLNGEALHRTLAHQPLAQRDAWWSMGTYYAFGSNHPLDRLIRWATRGPYPDYPDAVTELAAIPLAWLLASPNRVARDHATRGLTQLLHPRLDLIERLVARFHEIDDPYITQRIATVAHGAVLRLQPTDRGAVRSLLRRLVEDLIEDRSAVPNILTRDAVSGIADYGAKRLRMRGALIERARPPYGASPPKRPRSEAALESRYPRVASVPDHPAMS